MEKEQKEAEFSPERSLEARSHQDEGKSSS